MYWKNSLWIALILTIVGCSPAGQEEDHRPKGLVSAERLHSLLNAGENVQLIDVRPEEEFEAGHLPGAINVWRTDIQRSDTAYSGLRISQTDLEGVLSAKGVPPNAYLVLYDGKGCVDAARLWWLLRCYGHDNVALLDGGITAWDGEIEKGKSSHAIQQFVFRGKPHPEWMIDYDDFEKMREVPSIRLIDTRSDPEFNGEEQKSGAYMPGHIPGAVHYDYSHAIDYSDTGRMKFKPLADLKYDYQALANRDDTVLVYCHSGVRSAHTLFVLTELLRYPNVKNYDGSWVEWSYFNRPLQNDSLVTS